MLFRILFFLFPFALAAQNSEYLDGVYDLNIHAVKFYPSSGSLLMPIADLKANNHSLELHFDHLSNESRDYIYSIVHCNAEWQPTDLDQLEYITGFTEDRITEFQFSRLTLRPYISYTLKLPNNNMRWTKSGNYLLVVYDNETDETGERKLVIVRRFVVVENTWSIDVKFTPTTSAEKYNTHHELDFFIGHKGTRIANPQGEVRAIVLQNKRWDTAIGPLPPYSTRTDLLVFDYFDRIVFPAGKEWRTADIRSFVFSGPNIRSVEPNPTGYNVVVVPAEPEANIPPQLRRDLNGAFAIENTNPNQTIDQCEYASVLFSLLVKAERPDQDIYLFGELTEWQIKSQFKMTYDYAAKAYFVETTLKQGLYDYGFAAVNRDTGGREDETIDGNWYTTRNNYTVLVYYKPFGARYERLMAASSFSNE